MEFNLKNPYEERAKSVDSENRETRLVNRLKDKVKPKTYSQRFLNALRVSNVFAFVANGWNAATTFGAVLMAGAFLPYAYITAPILAVVIALLVELFKQSVARDFFNYFTPTNPITIVGLLVLVGVTLTASIYASTKIPQFLDGEKPVVEVDAQERERLQAVLEDKKKSIDSYRKTTWAGKLTRRSSAAISKLEESRDSLHQQLSLMQSQADAATAAAQAEQTSSHKEQGYLLVATTVFMESLFFFCLWYREYYDYKSACERAGIRELIPKKEPDPEEPADPTEPKGDGKRTERRGGNKGQNGKPNGYSLHPNGGGTMGPRSLYNGHRFNDNRDFVLVWIDEHGIWERTHRETGKKERSCKNCRQWYSFKNSRSKFCSADCRKEHWKASTGGILILKRNAS